MNKKLTRLKNIHRKKALKINIQNIKADQSKFQITLKNKFALLKENTPKIEELNEIISASIQELNENAMKTYATSEKDPEIEKLE